jgi:site-specific DNA recombinase
VIIESMSRLSRNSAVAFRIEEELSAAGVRLCCADEPLEESFGSIVLRHVNIGIARGYHHELMIKSRQGYETAATQGWHNGGIALYGYRFAMHQHPNPHKARTGQAKRTLELDPVRAPVVRRIYDEYLAGAKGIREIRDLLNSDPIAFPPRDAPDSTKAKGVWAGTSVWEILRNPKYTGYQVWNRRRRKKDNGTNPESEWIWSEEPSHPAIVSIDEWRAVHARAASNVRVRRARAAVDGADGSGRTGYLFRGLLVCGICGLRMWGQRPTSRCYRCQPSHQRSTGIPPDHPATVHIGEKSLLRAVADWLGRAVFGPDRTDYWRAALAASAQPKAARPRPTGSPRWRPT